MRIGIWILEETAVTTVSHQRVLNLVLMAMPNEVRWIFIAYSLLSSVVSFSGSASIDLSKIHEHMTDDELFSVFRVKNRTSVPDYEVVPIFHNRASRDDGNQRNRRSISSNEDEMYFTVTGQALKLYLEPVDHVLLGENTPVYMASGSKSQPRDIRYERVQKPWPSQFGMYQDPVNKAAVAMFKEPNGKVTFEGTVGNDFVIKPVPSRFQGISSFKDDEYWSHHFVYKKKPWDINSIFDDLDWEKYLFHYLPPKKHEKPRRVDSKVDVVYPEVLIIVDHETYLAHGKNVQALCKYMAAFWNGVDLRFRGMSEPKVRLNIAGLIVPSDNYGAPYMEYHREGKHYLRTMETFNDIGEYLYKEDRLPKSDYDFAVAITNFKLCIAEGSKCDSTSLGVARIGGACNHDGAVALLEDAGSFDGILTAAHEIAHLLGAVHDGEDSDSGPGATDCEWNGGYIMSATRVANGFLWSKCSIEQMRYFLRRGGECLRNKPIVKKALTKLLPGQLLSREDQCRVMHGMVECKMGENECGALWCKKPVSTFNYSCISMGPPAEGSPCSDAGICLDGKCVHQVEENNEVPEWNVMSSAHD